MDDRTTPELDLRRYIEILRRRKWVIGLAVVAVTVLAVGLSVVQEPVFEAGTRVLLQPNASEQSDVVGGGADRLSPEAVATEIEIMGSEPVEVAVQEALGRLPNVSFEAVSGTTVVEISAQADSAEGAAADANAYAEGYITARREIVTTELTGRADQLRTQALDLSEQLEVAEAPLREIEDQIASLPPEVDPAQPVSPERQGLLDSRDQIATETAEDRTSLEARVLTTQQDLDRVESALSLAGGSGAEVLAVASEPSGPTSPKPLRNGLLAAAIGLVMGIALALVLEVLDDRVRRKEDLAAASGGLSVLGLIPNVAGWRDRQDARVVSVVAPTSPPSEAYRTLRTSLQFLTLDEPAQVIQVTSANAGEGKTTTVANLGVALARAGQRVVVVCCDLRRPRIHDFYGVDNDIGFTSVLLGDATLDEAVQDVVDEPRLQILASGPPPPNPAELLSTKRARDVVEQLTERADVVLIDSPPVLPVTDALLVSDMVQITLMVAKAGSTNKRAVRRAVELLGQVDARLAGTVLNGAPMGGAYGYGGDYGYGYGASNYGPSKPTTRERRKTRSEPPHAVQKTA